jgi:WhiB family transcriptional regulator, redox-sensing transcriptional regulator
MTGIDLGERSASMSEVAFVRRTTWMSRSACKRADPELFFPSAAASADRTAYSRATEAKAFCACCPVRAECLAYALATRQKHGVWGGTTEDERRTMTRRNHRISPYGRA